MDGNQKNVRYIVCLMFQHAASWYSSGMHGNNSVKFQEKRL
jgi:hypothetical protein